MGFFEELGNLLISYWWILPILIILFIYMKYSNKETVHNLNLKEMIIFVELGFYFIIIYLFQNYLFNNHMWFLISLPIFIGIWSIAINYLLNMNNLYMFETTLQGEKFYDFDNKKEFHSLTTRQRLLIMDRSYYNDKNHVGQTNNPLWNASRNIKFCDYYDDKTGIFYHSEYDLMQNINAYCYFGAWLKMKEDIPVLIRENFEHTIMGDYKIAHQQKLLTNKVLLRLLGQARYTDATPFKLFKSLEDLIEISKAEKSHDKGDTNIIIEKSENSDNKEGDNSE